MWKRRGNYDSQGSVTEATLNKKSRSSCPHVIWYDPVEHREEKIRFGFKKLEISDGGKRALYFDIA